MKLRLYESTETDKVIEIYLTLTCRPIYNDDDYGSYCGDDVLHKGDYEIKCDKLNNSDIWSMIEDAHDDGIWEIDYSDHRKKEDMKLIQSDLEVSDFDIYDDYARLEFSQDLFLTLEWFNNPEDCGLYKGRSNFNYEMEICGASLSEDDLRNMFPKMKWD